MELRHIRYFIAVAEEGNFTRAAARLGIGQPPLSLQIKDLETEVGAALFHRVPHGAELTAAGQAFLEAVGGLPMRAAEAVRAAQRAARGESGQLTLAFTATGVLNPIVSGAIRTFRRTFPGVDLKLTESNSVAMAAGVRDGRLDVAVLRPAEADADHLTLVKLATEDLIIAVPASHSAARGRGPLDLALLKHDPLLLTPRTIGISLYDAAVDACRAAGFDPIMGQPAPQIASILALVAAELGFSLVPAAMRQFNLTGVAYRAVSAPVPRVPLTVAHRPHLPSPLALNFVKLARAEARKAAIEK